MRIRLIFSILLFLPSPNMSRSKVRNENSLRGDGAKIEDFFVVGVEVKMEYRRESDTDKNDYYWYPRCGEAPMKRTRQCFCGNTTLTGTTDLRDGDKYCCVPPSTSSQKQCKYMGWKRDSDVICENGEVKQKTQPCHQKCWNSYKNSENLYDTATLYCQEKDYCLSNKLMCSGVCKEEAEFCDSDSLRCIKYGMGNWWYTNDYTRKSLDTELAKEHTYCLKINNDQVYDSISREDEVKLIGRNEPTVNYTDLTLAKCQESDGQDGIKCSGDCKVNTYWCAGTGDVCIRDEGVVSLDNPELCRNITFWRKNNFSCDYYGVGGLLGVGERCSSDQQHCTWPWYTKYDGNIFGVYNPNCNDKSDQVFPINTTCRQFNQKFLNTYWINWCTDTNGEKRKKEDGSYCDGGYDNLEYWYSRQTDNLIKDPHGCQQSCKTTSTGADCVACEHPDFFHCNSTGFCIHKDLVCDHHPHPRCGGDDEGVHQCLEVYFKRRIVKSYATLICQSKMYPEMETLAVVCDDHSECAEDRDEALCATGADEYNPIVYTMTAGACMVYVVLKLVWFFHLQHQPVGDEDDPPTHCPTRPTTRPPTRPPTHLPTRPHTRPPTRPPNRPPDRPPTRPPTRPPVLPLTRLPTRLPTRPPALPLTRPPTRHLNCPPNRPPIHPLAVALPISPLSPSHFRKGKHRFP